MNEQSIYKKKWRKNNPDKHKEHSKRYRVKNKEKIKEYSKIYNSKPESCYNIYVNSARVRDYEFNMSYEEFIIFWQKPCSYCGVKIETIGLDRIDSNFGYILGNVKSCCRWCNIMKSNYTEEEFINKCNKITNYSKNA